MQTTRDCPTCGGELTRPLAREIVGENGPCHLPWTGTVLAHPYDARRCPICGVWVFTAAGPFDPKEGIPGPDGRIYPDETKELATFLHWRDEHATPEDLSGDQIGFPFFDYNDVPVQAVLPPRQEEGSTDDPVRS
jgi:hypothetical protein